MHVLYVKGFDCVLAMPYSIFWETEYSYSKVWICYRFCCYSDESPYFNDPGMITSENEEMVVHFDATWPQATSAYTETVAATWRQGFKMCYTAGEWHLCQNIPLKCWISENLLVTVA